MEERKNLLELLKSNLQKEERLEKFLKRSQYAEEAKEMGDYISGIKSFDYFKGSLNYFDPDYKSKILEINDEFTHKTYEVFLYDNTLIFGNLEEKDEIFHIYGKPIEDKTIIPFIVINDDFYLFLKNKNLLDKNFHLLTRLSRMKPEHRKSIIDQLTLAPKHEEVIEPSYLLTKEDLRLKFELCKETYLPEQQTIIQNLLQEIHDGKSKAYQKLKFILNISPVYRDKEELSYEELRESLDRKLYKLDKVKDVLCNFLITRNYTQNKNLKLLLVGNPGTGKTSIARAVAEAYNLPYNVIPLQSITTSLDLKGTDSTYEFSEPGLLTQAFYTMKTTEGIIVLDEIDKMGYSPKEGNPYSAILDFLDNSSYDQYLEFPLDTSNTIVIATANSTDKLTPQVLDRFKIINIDDYTQEDKVYIAKNYLLPEILEDLPEKFRDKIEIPENVIKSIIENYCDDFGIRKLRSNLEKLVRDTLNQFFKDENLERIEIEEKDLENSLKDIVDKNNPIIIYNRNKKKYPKATQDLIEKLIRDQANPSTLADEKEKNKKLLNYLVHIIPDKNYEMLFDEDKFFDEVNKTHYGMEEIKSSIAKTFYLNSLQDKKITDERILIHGSPGTGKSSIVESLSKALNIPLVKISVNGVMNVSYIKGINRQFNNSDAGVLVQELAKLDRPNAIVWLDEVDKITSQGISNILLELLDDAKTFTDLYLGVPIDLSNILFIATANDVSKIDPIVLDRFKKISLSHYSPDEKLTIAQNYLIPELSQKYSKEIVMDKEDINFLIDNYCPNPGIRELKHYLSDIVRNKLFNERGLDTYKITREDVIKTVGEKPISLEAFPNRKRPGLVKGLAVANVGYGFPTVIESLVLKNSKEIKVTGLLRESIIESIKLAVSYIEENFNYNFSDKGLHVHFSRGSIEKDGTSAGVAILISILSTIFNKEVSGDYAFTGEIDLFGNVYAVGGINEKVQGALRSECSTVFIPDENYQNLKSDEKFLELSKQINIIPVNHIDEVVQVVLPSILEENIVKL